MILAIVISVVLCTFCCSAQTTDITQVDDQINWAEMLKVLKNTSKSDGRADDDRDVFDRILRANAIERATGRSGSYDFLFQGDILINKSDIDILNSGSLRRKRAVSTRRFVNLWEANRIVYNIDQSLGRRADLAIKEAIQEWEATLPCMGKWRDVTKETTRPRDYIKFFKGKGCYSQVGRQRGQQPISIGERCVYHGVVVHEIGHAMGFWHEQSRPDRDTHVKIIWDNIIPSMKFNFNKYSTSKINSLGVSYDYNSVMHYGKTAFSKDGSSLTIEPIKSGVRIGQRRGLSDKDKEQAGLLYGCKDTRCTKDLSTSNNCASWKRRGFCDELSQWAGFMKNNCCMTCKSGLPCDSSPCLNGGRCNNQGTTFKCSCRSGFKGVRCDQKILPCHFSPCLNGGICSNQQGTSFKCTCQSGYKGVRCEQKVLPCDSSPCLNGGNCNNQGSTFNCVCASGFKGLRCQQQILPCDSSPCWNGGICSNQGMIFKCSCQSGFKGVRCGQKDSLCAIDISPSRKCTNWKRQGFCDKSSRWHDFMKDRCCATCRSTVLPCDSSPCLNGGTCNDEGTTFKCSCESGFKGVTCEQKILPCDSLPCLNGGTCSNQGTTFKCSCGSGFKGATCEQKSTMFRCTKGKDIATSGNCVTWKAQGFCRDTSIWSGFMKDNCCMTCQSALPCDSSPCLNGGKCVNQSTRFKCNCTTGFHGVRCEQRGCKDLVVYCKSWSKSGFCDGQFKDYMKANCAQSCGC